MKKTIRRISALILALALVFPLLPGILSAPLEIKAAAATIPDNVDLEDFIVKNGTGGNYELAGNITITKPMTSTFTGTLDGKGYTINVNGNSVNKYLDLYTPAYDSLPTIGSTSNKDFWTMKDKTNFAGGVFTHVKDGTIKNVNVVLQNDVKMKGRGDQGSDYFGGLVGNLDGGTLQQCSVTGTITATQEIPATRTFSAETALGDLASIKSAYSGYATTLAVGGIVGFASVGADIVACYSNTTIYTGGSDRSSVRYMLYSSESSTSEVVDTSVACVLIAGGIAGEQASARIRDNHVDNTKIYMANTNSNLKSSTGTYAFAGGLVGRKSRNDWALYYNLITNTTINAKPAKSTFGTGAGAAAWFTDNPTEAFYIRDNYGYNVTLDAPKNHERGYYGTIYSSVDSNNTVTLTTFTFVREGETIPLGTALNKEVFDYYVNGDGIPVQKWRAIPAPDLGSRSLNTEGFAIAINPPAKNTLTGQELYLSAEDIRYELTVTGTKTSTSSPNQVPGVTQESTGEPQWQDFSAPVLTELAAESTAAPSAVGMLASPLVDDSELAAGIIRLNSEGTLKWGNTPDNLDNTDPVIDLKLYPMGNLLNFYVQAVSDDPNYVDSNIISFSAEVKPDVHAPANLIFWVGNVNDANEKTSAHAGKLSVPSAMLDSTKTGLILTPPPEASIEWGFSETQLNIRGTFIPLDTVTGDTAVFYARSVSALTDNPPESSNTVRITLTRAPSDSSQAPAAQSLAEITPFASTEVIFTNVPGSKHNPVDSISYDGKTMALISSGFSVEANSAATLKVWMNNSPAIAVTYNLAAGDTTAAPTILPEDNGSLADGITIPVTGNEDVCYFMVGTNSEGKPITQADKDKIIADNRINLIDNVSGNLFAKATKTTNTEDGTKYVAIPWSEIQAKFDADSSYDTLWIIAAAKDDSGLPNNPKTASAISIRSYNVNSKKVPVAPKIKVYDGVSNFVGPDPNTYYKSTGMVDADEFSIEHDEYTNPNVSGEIWYTTNGGIPAKHGVNSAKFTGDFTLPGNRNTVTINAIWFRDNYPPSEMATITLNMYSKYGSPIFSIANHQSIPIGQTLEFMVADADLPKDVRPHFYINTSDSTIATERTLREYPGSYYGVLTDKVRTDFMYSDYSKSLPTLYYTITYHAFGDVEERSTEHPFLYNLGTPEIQYTDGTTSNHIPGDRIVLNGLPGQTITVTAWLVPSSPGSYEEGDPAEYTYTFFQPTELPVAAPPTSFTNMTSLAVGDTIYLTCKDLDADIFYSTSGPPFVTNYNPTDGSYTLGDKTFLYDRTTGIKVTGTPGGSFTVFAGAIAKNKSASEIASFYYKIAELPVVAAPTASPNSDAGNPTILQNGSSVILQSATSGAQIFYSTTGAPSIVPNENGSGYKAGTGTTLFSNSITVNGTPGEFYVISAIAVKDGMNASETVSFNYKIAELPVVEAPTASPNSDGGTPVTLQSGSVITLQSATSGAQIFYSTTGNPTVTQSGSAGTGTSLFSNSITVSGEAGEFFVVRAIAVKSGMANSEISTFTYQLPAAVQSVYATPAAGTVVKGTEVKLATTTEGATIYYETATTKSGLSQVTTSKSQVYNSPIKVDAETHVRAIAVKDGVESTVTEFQYKVATQVKAPKPSLTSGSVVAKGAKLTLTSETSGASFVYTKDGSDPTDEKNTNRMFGADIVIDAEEGKSVILSAYATKSGMSPSEVVSLSYTVSKAEDVISANPPADTTVKPGDKITLTTSVSGASIYYTTDGSEPTKKSTKGSAVTVDGVYGESFTVRAIAATETTTTMPYTFSYKVIARTPAPSASIPDGAIILTGATVALSAPEGNIYYTTDGSDPIAGGSQLYTEPFGLSGSTVLKAVASVDGKAPSEISEYVYTMAGQVAAPTASLGSGSIDVGSKITLSSSTEGATIYYTTNGATPSMDNLRDCSVYDSPITISRPVSIRMFAVRQGLNPSVVNTVTYTVVYPVEEEPEPETELLVRNTDRLFLFDQFVDSGEGPMFEDIVLRDGLTLTVVSAAGDALPEDVQLVVVRDRNPSAEDEDAVARALEMKMASLYSVFLVDQDGNPVQPLKEEGVELGIPIPEGYEDTIILICRINDNGTVTAFPTRRFDNMAYAVVDHFSKYAIAVPALPGQESSGLRAWQLWLIGIGAVLAAGSALVTVIIITRKNGTVPQ